jgi:DNA-binding transcriptional regulator GbsR (MarR family)
MNTEERVKAQWDLIDTIGRTYDKQGFGVIPGRVIGFLTVMDKEQFTFEEIVDALQISKSSASNAIRILEARNQIEYFTLPGDRKRYFHVRRQDRFALIDEHQTMLKKSRDLFHAMLEVKVDKKSPTAIFLKDVENLLTVFLDKFEELRTEFMNKQ